MMFIVSPFTISALKILAPVRHRRSSHTLTETMAIPAQVFKSSTVAPMRMARAMPAFPSLMAQLIKPKTEDGTNW